MSGSAAISSTGIPAPTVATVTQSATPAVTAQPHMAPSLSFPPAAGLETLDGTNWPAWSLRIQALLRLNNVRKHITETSPNTSADPNKDPNWDTVEEMLLGMLEMYVQKDVWTRVADDSKFTTLKAKWDELKRAYGGVGAMSTFNSWVSLTSTKLDENSPLLPQLQKLNDTRLTLDSNEMKITDLQFCFILLKALPDSYSTVASTILAATAPDKLTPQILQERFLNEEGRRSAGSASLNKVAPVKKGDKQKVKCHYCKKSGHKSNECRKKKRDEEEKDKDKKDKDKSSTNTPAKSVNTHTIVPTTATITEIADSDEEIRVSAYSATRSRWMVDSGATHHITPHRSDFASWRSTSGLVSLGGHAEIKQIGTGSVIVRPAGGDGNIKLTLHNVMHVPDAHARYFSVSALLRKGGKLTFDGTGFNLFIGKVKVARGYIEDNLFWLDTSLAALNAHTVSQPLELWHQRMGHMSFKALSRYSSAVSGLTLDTHSSPTDQDLFPCPGCELGKHARLPFPRSNKRSVKRLQVVHSDLAGPIEIRSIRGALYIATFIDDFSRHGVVYFLKSKDQCADAFKKFLAWAETQTTEKLLALHSDRGGEYISGALQSVLDAKGIEHKLTMPGSPQQNGVAERWNRTIFDKVRALLHSAGLSPGFWEQAADTAVHIYNRTPTRVLDWRTPIELWTGNIPDVSYFRVFGCKAYVHVPEGKRRKLDPRAIEMMFIGYEPGSKGYRLWNPTTRAIVLSRDVTFDERSFPAKASSPPSAPPTRPLVLDGPALITLPVSEQRGSAPPVPPAGPALAAPAPQIVQPPPQNTPSHTTPKTPPNRPLEQRQETEFYTPPSALPPDDSESPGLPLPSPPPAPRKRVILRLPVPAPGLRRPPNSSLPGPSFGDPSGPPSPRRLRANPRPNSKYTTQDPGTDTDPPSQRQQQKQKKKRSSGQLSHLALLAAAEYQDPLTFKQAMASDYSDDWRAACQYEIDALAKNSTWTLVDLPTGRKAVKSKWVFKRKADGRFRARLVAKGFTQVHGIDYDETFSPVARFESLRLLLALAALADWEIHQMDVKSAFLNGLLDEEIYMEQPTGFVVPGQSNKVCLLQKAIYGLKQASRAWNLQFHSVLLDLGFTRTHSDAGVYHRQDAGGSTIIIILYVDDITILGDKLRAIENLKATLANRYEMTDLGEIDSYLGVRIKRDRSIRRLDIDQSRYISEIVNRFGLADSNPARTPLPAGAETHLVKNTGEATASEIKYYQQIIGSLLYVQIGTRPDISFAVGRLAQYASNPSSQHLRLAKYVLAYLKGTADLVLRYDGARGNGLYGYSDSSLGDQLDDCHSTSGFVYLLADAAISWSSRKQKTVAQSTTHAEYMALTDAANQAAWYRSFFSEIGFDVLDPILLHGDNKGAVDLALNPVTGRRSKHIPIKFHAIREYIEDGFIHLIRTPTGDMLADGLTKPHAHVQLGDFVTGLGLI